MIDKIKLFLAIAIVIAGIAIFYQFDDWQQIARVGVVVIAVVIAMLLWFSTEIGKANWEFMTSARTEVRKVVWPGRKETMQVTGYVIAGAIAASIYMWLLDWISFYAIYNLILGVRGS